MKKNNPKCTGPSFMRHWPLSSILGAKNETCTHIPANLFHTEWIKSKKTKHIRVTDTQQPPFYENHYFFHSITWSDQTNKPWIISLPLPSLYCTMKIPLTFNANKDKDRARQASTKTIARLMVDHSIPFWITRVNDVYFAHTYSSSGTSVNIILTKKK